MGRVTHLYIAPERGAVFVPVSQVEALTDVGLRGDRYSVASNRRSADYQVTLIEHEHIDAFARRTGFPLDPGAPRRNIVTAGVRLNDLVGETFTVGDAQLVGLELCEPCTLFRDRTHVDVLTFFVRKGGLRARIQSGGIIRVGDPISLPLA